MLDAALALYLAATLVAAVVIVRGTLRDHDGTASRAAVDALFFAPIWPVGVVIWLRTRPPRGRLDTPHLPERGSNERADG